MARQVGSVEVVVDADTGKLRAQIVSEAAKAGREGAEALSRGLADVDTAGALEEVHKLAIEIERDLESIDPDITVDTRRVKEELDRLKARVAAELLEFDTEVDFTEVNAQIAAFREEQERNTIDLSFGVDLQNINRRVEVMRREIEANEIKLNLGADLKSITASVDAFRREQETDAVDINFGTDMAKINARIAAWRKEVEANEINLRLDTDLTRLNASIAAWRREVEAPRVNIKFRPDLAELNARIAAFRLRQQRNDVEVPVKPDVDTNAWARARLALNAWGKGSGKSSGGSFNSGFASSLGDGSTLIIGAIAAFGPAMAEGLEGLLSAGTAVISSAFSAIAGGGLAAAAGVAAFGGAAAAAVVGTRGFKDALSAINTEFETAREEGREMRVFSGDVADALNRLAPSAAATARAFAGIKDELRDAQLDVQETLFAGMDRVVGRFAQTTLPNVTGALQIAAGSVNHFVQELAKVAENTDFVGTMEGLKPALDNALTAATNFIDALSPFLKTAGGTDGPAAALTGYIAQLSEDFNTFVKANPKKITDFLTGGEESLERWLGLIGDTTKLLFHLFDAGKTKGDNFVTSFDNMITRWDTFVTSKEGQSKLEDFFNRGKDAIDDFRPVFDGLQEAMSILTSGKNAQSFSDLLQSLGDSLPSVAEALTTLSQLQLGTTFLDTLAFMRPLLELVNQLDPDILKLTGSMLLFSKSVRAVGLALTEEGLANSWILGIGAALTGVVALMQFMTSESESQREGVNELSDAYSTAIDNILNFGDAQSGAQVASDAWTQALQGLGSDSKDLEVALGTLNTGMDEARDTFEGLQKGGDTARDTLQGLAEAAGLTSEDALTLANIVNDTNDNFSNLGDAGGSMAQATIRFDELSKSSGLSVEQLLETAAAMEEVQDQSRKHNLEDVAEQQVKLAASGDTATQALLAQAEANTGVSRTAENVVPLLDEMAALGFEQAKAAKEAADAGLVYVESLGFVRDIEGESKAQSIEWTNALDDQSAALKASRDEAYQTFLAEQRLADQTKEIAATVAESEFGLPEGVATGIIELGDAFDQTSAAADALTDALDTLFGSFPNQQEAISNTEQALDDMREQLSGMTAAADGSQEAVEGWAATLNLSDQAGRDNAAAIRDAVSAMNDQAAASIKAGDSAEAVTLAWKAQHQQIVDAVAALYQQQAAQDGVNLSLEDATARAETYVDALSGAPDVVETVINQPGLIDALLNAEDLTVLYDSMGNPVITEFEALGLDVTDEQARALYDLITNLDETTAAPTVNVNDNATDPLTTTQEQVDTLDASSADPLLQITTYVTVTQALGTIARQLTAIDEMIIDPKITLPTYETTKTHIATLDTMLTNLPDPIVNIFLPNIHTDIANVQTLIDKLNGLHDKSITVSVNQSGAVPQLMAGGIVAGRQTATIGEFGMAEAVVPLELPLSRVDPSVRWMAELIRGGGSSRGGLTVNQTIVTQTEDTVSVAAQVVNRMSAEVSGLL